MNARLKPNWLILFGIALFALLPSAHAYYDPVPQRWINRDPLDERGGINMFAFIRNQPIHAVDPFGQEGTNFPIIFPPIQIPQWPPPNPWPTNPISADAGKGGVTIHSGNAPAACLAPSPKPCPKKGARGNSTEPKKTGAICADGRPQRCYEYDLCTEDGAVAKNGQTRLSWKTIRKCNCY
jgi:hypothetical protein